jgi:hypothetical protein
MQGPAEPIESPHDERVTRPKLIEHLGELFAVVERAGCPVGEDPKTTCCFQGIALEAGVLIERRDPRIAEKMTDISKVSETIFRLGLRR